MGTTRMGLVRPGGGEGESLVGIYKMRERTMAGEIIQIRIILFYDQQQKPNKQTFYLL